MQKKRYEKPVTKFVADTDVVLECLHEVYGLEGKQVLSRKNIHSTMIYPFIKMLENQCKDIPAEKLHKMLWEVYEAHSETADFKETDGRKRFGNSIIPPDINGDRHSSGGYMAYAGIRNKRPGDKAVSFERWEGVS